VRQEWVEVEDPSKRRKWPAARWLFGITEEHDLYPYDESHFEYYIESTRRSDMAKKIERFKMWDIPEAEVAELCPKLWAQVKEATGSELDIGGSHAGVIFGVDSELEAKACAMYWLVNGGYDCHVEQDKRGEWWVGISAPGERIRLDKNDSTK
jgi:hypothetical protein